MGIFTHAGAQLLSSSRSAWRVPGKADLGWAGHRHSSCWRQHEARLVPAELCLSHTDGRAGTVACCDRSGSLGGGQCAPATHSEAGKPALPNPGTLCFSQASRFPQTVPIGARVGARVCEGH